MKKKKKMPKRDHAGALNPKSASVNDLLKHDLIVNDLIAGFSVTQTAERNMIGITAVSGIKKKHLARIQEGIRERMELRQEEINSVLDAQRERIVSIVNKSLTLMDDALGFALEEFREHKAFKRLISREVLTEEGEVISLNSVETDPVATLNTIAKLSKSAADLLFKWQEGSIRRQIPDPLAASGIVVDVTPTVVDDEIDMTPDD